MNVIRILLVGCLLFGSIGCASYAGVSRLSQNKVLILKNDGFLFGFKRKAMVCDVSPQGVSNCKTKGQP